MKSRTFAITTLILCLALVISAAGFVVYVDPYLHYHTLTEGLEYPLEKDRERYINDGIMRHFDYDAVIAGSSETSNFTVSEMDALFGCKSVKDSIAGASFRETAEALEKAWQNGHNVRYVVRCLDSYTLYEKWNEMHYDAIPTYLYDDDIFNDVQYVFNSAVWGDCIKVLQYTKEGKKTPSLDLYGTSWPQSTYSREIVLRNYNRRQEPRGEQRQYEQLIPLVKENMEKNVLNSVQAHPETEFYIYFPPYSIIYWDRSLREGSILQILECEKAAMEVLLPYPNVHLFGFLDCIDIICNLDHYKDPVHYGPEINSYILACMAEDQYRLTEDNYLLYCDRVKEFYMNFDYNSIF